MEKYTYYNMDVERVKILQNHTGMASLINA